MQKTNSQNTKRSLIMCGLSLVLCLVLLTGVTFAWFTDSVTNQGNHIQAGTLSIDAIAYDITTDSENVVLTVKGIPGINNGEDFSFEKDGQNLKDSNKPIINDTLFEPGKSNAKLLEVRNNDSLAAKIKLQFSIQDDGLQDALWFDFVQVNEDGSVSGTFVKRPMNTLGTFAENLEISLLPDDSIRFVLVYGMNEEAGNEYQGKSFSADVAIVATQETHEVDGFGSSNYDEDAMYDNGDGTFTQNGKLYVKAGENYVEVTPSKEVTGLYIDTNDNNYVASGEAVNYVFSKAENGENITFITDVTFSAVGSSPFLTVNNATVDLNGKTVTVNKGYGSNAFGVTGDGSVVKNGTFKCGADRDDYPLWITGNTGSNHVTVENVTVEGGMQVIGTVSATLKNVKITANHYYDVYMAQNSKVTVESGEFTSTGNYPHFYIQNYSSSYNPTVIINGGSFSGGTPTVGVMNSNKPYTFENNIQ